MEYYIYIYIYIYIYVCVCVCVCVSKINESDKTNKIIFLYDYLLFYYSLVPILSEYHEKVF